MLRLPPPLSRRDPSPPAQPPPARLGLIAAASVSGLVGVWLLCLLLDRVGGSAWTDARVADWVGAATALVAGGLCWLTARRPTLAPAAIVSATSVAVAGLALAALHGTRWNFSALYSDAGFRTQAATRFADSPGLTDYGYRGLPSYYPPALPWIQGRLADWVDVPAWSMMKPVTIALALLVPVLAHLMWRRVVPDLTSACVVAATTLVSANLTKPDEWLVLALLVPWWLELVRGVRRPCHRPWPVWAHGAVLGTLLLFHSYYFLPLGVATVVAALVDAARRRPMALRPARAFVIGALALVVAAPYWVGMARERLAGAPGDDLQRRWSEPGFTAPTLPVPTDVVGVLGLVGLVWLLLRMRSARLAEALAVALGTAYAVMIGGQWLQRAGVAVLPEKTDALVVALLVAAGVLALHDLWCRWAPRMSRRGGLLVATALAVVSAPLLSIEHAEAWVTGRPAQAAQEMPYPDGGHPAGGGSGVVPVRHPWSVTTSPIEPTVAEVEEQWRRLTGRSLDSETVLVTSRADLLATRPAHAFVAWKSIYSHPYGQFEDRLRLLRSVSTCPDPRCAAELLRENRFDAVDGLILTRTEDGLRFSVATDTFPDAWKVTRIHFPEALFAAPWFERRDVGEVAVVSLVAPAGPVTPGPRLDARARRWID